MTGVTTRLEARLRTIPNTTYVAARTVVALPPSDLDPRVTSGGTTYDGGTAYDEDTTYWGSYTYGLLRVDIQGTRITRAYDDALEQP